MNVSDPVIVSTTVPNTICRTGFIVRAPQVGFIQRGTHRLVDSNGNVIATLQSNTINLFRLENGFFTVCGLNEGIIEGVLSINVTQVFQATRPAPAPSTQLDLRTLLIIILLTQPNLLRNLRPELLLTLLLSTGLLGSGLSGAGLLGTGLLGTGLFSAGILGTGGLGLGALGSSGFGSGILGSSLGGTPFGVAGNVPGLGISAI